MTTPLVTFGNLSLNFGSKDIFDDISFSIYPGDAIGLVGRNGMGKSTLFKLIQKEIETYEGRLFHQPGVRIQCCPQEPSFEGYDTFFSYCLEGLAKDQRHEEHLVHRLLEQIGLSGDLSPKAASGGEKRRASLVRALVGSPDVLLLDEPTNHLDLSGILWLEETLRDFQGATVIISHDRRFLSRVTRAVLWLDRGIIRRLDRGFDAFEDWADGIIAQEQRAQKKLSKVIKEETRWSHQGITARRKRNQGRLRRLEELRAVKASHLGVPGRARLTLKEDKLASQMVIEAKKITKNAGDRTLFKDFSLRIMAGDRLGIVGPNGCGKSTLIQTLLGETPPDHGHVRMGKNLSLLYFDQSRQELDPQKTLWETLAISGTDQVMVQDRMRHVVGYLKEFLFDPDQARSPVSSLSGGEKSRLLLAKALARPSNFLVLDEPTNDLDMDTLDLLTEVLLDYQGTILVVSHDRDFLDHLVTSTLVFSDHHPLVEVAGGYSDAMAYLEGKPTRSYEKSSPSLAVGGSKKDGGKKGAPRDGKEVTYKKNRLSYHETRLLEVLPKEIEGLYDDLRAIEEKLAAPHDHGNGEDIHALSVAHEKIRQELEEKETQWFELAKKEESLV